MFYKFLFVVLAFALLSCNENSSVKTEKQPVITQPVSVQMPDKVMENEFAGKLFLLGQGFSNRCQIENQCDCCNSELLFLNSEEFVYNSLCEGSEYVVKGKYEVNDKVLIMHFAPLAVSYEYNWEQEVDSTAVAFFTKVERKAIPDTKFSIEKCNGETLIAFRAKKANEFGMFDATSNNAEKIKDLKEKGIWQKLEME